MLLTIWRRLDRYVCVLLNNRKMKLDLQLALALCLLYTIPTYAQKTYTSNDKTHLWGSIKIQNLEKAPFADWYSESKEEFTPQLPSSHYSNLSDVTLKYF